MTFVEKISNIWQSVLEAIFPIWKEFVSIIADLTNLPEKYAHRVVLGFILYLIFLLVFGLLHKKLFLTRKNKVKKCVYEYDRVRYLTARSMYFYNKHLEKQGQPGKLVHGTRSILKLENRDYFQNKEKIFSDVKKLEVFFKQEVVSKKVFKKINFFQNKISFWDGFQKIVGWGLVVFTFGLYLVTWKKLDS